MRAVKSLWALALLPVLAGCGAAVSEDPYTGGIPPYTPPSGGGTATANYTALYNETQDLRSRYPVNAAAARAAQIPTSGTALYQGTATLRVPTRDNLSLLGDASILANFDRDSVTGTLGNFTSVRDGQSQAAAWNGNLSLSSTDNLGINVSRANHVRADVTGNLYSGTNTISVDGKVDGNFHNYGYGNATGLSASMQNGGAIRYNGTTYSVGNRATVSGDGTPAGLSIVTER